MSGLSTKSELMAAIRGLSAARELPPDVILDALKAALRSAYDKSPDRQASNVSVEFDDESGGPRVYGHYVVTEETFIEDPLGEMTPEQASEHKADAKVGDVITLEVTPDDFGRIAAQTAKQVILQRIREAEREQTYMTYADREGEIVYGTVQTANRDLVTVALDRVEAILPKSGQIPGERYAPNQRVRVYVAEVKRSPKGPQVIVSRTHKNMLLRLAELEIPEVYQGVVEIKAIAREAGSRSKMAVWSMQSGVDPVGACVGMRGVRIQSLVRELGGEKIDVVQWAPDPRELIKNALSPAKVMYVHLEAGEQEIATLRGTANVIVPDDQLSLAIGREGQNARLAAKLTGWRIDIRAESESEDIIEKIRSETAEEREERARQAAEALEAAAAARMPAPADADEAEAAEEAEAETVTEVAAEAVAEDDAAVTPASVEQIDLGPEEPEPAEDAVPEAPLVEEVDLPAAEPAAPVAAEATREPAGEPEPAAERPAARRSEPRREELYDDDDDDLGGGAQPRRKRRLVRDPKTGELVAKKRRKRSRRRSDWEDEIGRWEGEDEFDDTMGFTEDDFLGSDDDDDEDE